MSATNAEVFAENLRVRAIAVARLLLVGCAASAIVSLSACSPPAADTTADAPVLAENIVARQGPFTVTAAEFDRFIVAMPTTERPVPGTDLDQWYREQIREYLIEQHLLLQAQEAGMDTSSDFLQARAHALRERQIALCIQSQLVNLPPIEHAELQAEFDQNAELFRKPERRLTLHLFRRAAGAVEVKAASTELDGYRDRVLNGESFGLLATAHSDSESRHRGGELGWLVRGELPAAIDDLVFSLHEGVPSQPFETADGLHIFFVQSLVPAREATLVEAMPALRERLRLRRVEAQLKPINEADTRDFGMPDRASFVDIINAGDGQSILLADGEFRLDLATFRRRLGQLPNRAGAAKPGALPMNAAWSYLQALRTREKLRSACEREDWVAPEAVAEGVEQWSRNQLISERRKLALQALASADEQRLRQYYTQNIEQFSSPVRWSLRRLRIPLDQQSTQTMAVLERAAESDGSSIDALQSLVGGSVDSLPEQQLANLREIAPGLPALISPLEPGELSAPLRTLEHLEIFALEQRSEPSAASFESVREQVVRTYAQHHAAQLYQQFADQLFAAEPIAINPEALQSLVRAGLPELDISPETLDQLLEAL